jgi:hypothetical protein
MKRKKNESENHFIYLLTKQKEQVESRYDQHTTLWGDGGDSGTRGAAIRPTLDNRFLTSKAGCYPQMADLREQCCHQMGLTLVPRGLGRYLVAMTPQRPSVCLTPLIQATVRIRCKTKTTWRQGNVDTHKMKTRWRQGNVDTGYRWNTLTVVEMKREGEKWSGEKLFVRTLGV